MVKEVNGHVDNKHWELVKQEEVPEDAQVVPSIWSMRCKRNLTTNKINKHNARLNLHGGKQVFGMNYFETYVPVVTWFAIKLGIIMGIIFNWALCQVDFVMAYPQAPVETDIYMLPPRCHRTFRRRLSATALPPLTILGWGQNTILHTWNPKYQKVAKKVRKELRHKNLETPARFLI